MILLCWEKMLPYAVKILQAVTNVTLALLCRLPASLTCTTLFKSSGKTNHNPTSWHDEVRGLIGGECFNVAAVAPLFDGFVFAVIDFASVAHLAAIYRSHF